uniref:Uncharacterized protein n=1 Tax=Plectus sambesii TaxID=2011161 RepID=A0A914WEX5_9BILA
MATTIDAEGRCAFDKHDAEGALVCVLVCALVGPHLAPCAPLLVSGQVDRLPIVVECAVCAAGRQQGDFAYLYERAGPASLGFGRASPQAVSVRSRLSRSPGRSA